MPSLTSGASAALAQEQVTAPGFQQGPGLIGRERLLVLLDSWPCSMGGSSRRARAPPGPFPRWLRKKEPSSHPQELDLGPQYPSMMYGAGCVWLLLGLVPWNDPVSLAGSTLLGSPCAWGMCPRLGCVPMSGQPRVLATNGRSVESGQVLRESDQNNAIAGGSCFLGQGRACSPSQPCCVLGLLASCNGFTIVPQALPGPPPSPAFAADRPSLGISRICPASALVLAPFPGTVRTGSELILPVLCQWVISHRTAADLATLPTSRSLGPQPSVPKALRPTPLRPPALPWPGRISPRGAQPVSTLDARRFVATKRNTPEGRDCQPQRGQPARTECCRKAPVVAMGNDPSRAVSHVTLEGKTP
ncbi:hypothetical protein TREES_T100000980 [Tupaia chinensis]|uniref:Uncharacterized protein n=1 Tax=Tupaia chinensis TaxID=246437 RepID=L9JC49_TUPCH|nr:hypothetical protein TREES_T100000980 [Tupaia chinensis]